MPRPYRVSWPSSSFLGTVPKPTRTERVLATMDVKLAADACWGGLGGRFDLGSSHVEQDTMAFLHDPLETNPNASFCVFTHGMEASTHVKHATGQEGNLHRL